MATNPSEDSRRIILVDDDRNILASVSIAIGNEGFSVETFTDGEQGLRAILANPPALVVLDIKMPRMDGMEVLSRLRRTSQVPVIFLTSKDDEGDQIEGLRMGADDYITKPFSVALLIQRILTVLRREQMRAQPAGSGKAFLRGPLAMDANRQTCTWKGRPVDLTVTEFLIVWLLAEHPGHVKTRNQMIDAAYGENIYVDDRTIDSHVKRIRRKFRDSDPDFAHIETLYGAGYRFVEP